MKRLKLYYLFAVISAIPFNSFSQDTTRIKGGFVSRKYENTNYGSYNEVYKYDENGHLMFYGLYYVDYGITYYKKKTEQTFDKAGRIIEFSEYNQDYTFGNCNETNGEKWSYNASGKLAEDFMYYIVDGKIKQMNREVMKYDTSGYMTEDLKYDNDDSLYEKEVWKYDAAGNAVDSKIFDSKNNLKNTEKIIYDNDGNRSERKMYDAKGAIVRKASWKYYNNGLKREYDLYVYSEKGSAITLETWKFDAVGNVTECIRLNNDGSFRDDTKYQYDDNGNVSVESDYDNSGKLIKEKKYSYYK